VEITGTVKDSRPYQWRASLAAAPIAYGAGIQNKVLEAMACGTPVVASGQAVSALEITPGRDVWVADTPSEFARAILELLNNASKREELGLAGRAYVEREHDWNGVVTKLEEIYARAIQIKKKADETH
jgi:glycosyltransferase involved in cell wall biosynthesis